MASWTLGEPVVVAPALIVSTALGVEVSMVTLPVSAAAEVLPAASLRQTATVCAPSEAYVAESALSAVAYVCDAQVTPPAGSRITAASVASDDGPCAASVTVRDGDQPLPSPAIRAAAVGATVSRTTLVVASEVFPAASTNC